MTLLTNSFEGGTSGTTITTGNSGGGSGSAFDTVTIGSGATVAYDNGHAAHGLLAGKIATGVSSVQALTRWDSSMGTQTQIWFRTYLYFTANPAASVRVVQIATGGGSLCAAFTVNTAGKVAALDSGATQRLISTNAVPLNAWWRLEGTVITSTSVGQLEFKVFTTSMDSSSPDETKTSAASFNTQASAGIYQFGVGGSLANAGPFWQDDLGLSSTGYIGPALTASPVPYLSQNSGMF